MAVMGRGMEYNVALGVCVTERSAQALIKDIKEYLKPAQAHDGKYAVDFDAPDWEKKLARRNKYLKAKPWGEDAFGCDELYTKRVPVRWMA